MSAALPLAAATPAPIEGAGSCYTAPEVRASQVRQLQTELMVAALSCNGYPDLGLRARYNAFVTKFGGNLNDTAKVLRGHFQRNHGRDHVRRFDAYVTALANQAALRSFDEPAYCQSVVPVFEALAGMEPREVENFAAREVAVAEAVMPCAAPRR
ncbi:MAG: hypothetical protein WCZ23_03645 [Rhodospirillaceae bacterium]